jgi:hypothetical protein
LTVSVCLLHPKGGLEIQAAFFIKDRSARIIIYTHRPHQNRKTANRPSEVFKFSARNEGLITPTRKAPISLNPVAE